MSAAATWRLLGAIAVVGGLDVAARSWVGAANAPLPTLPAVDPATVSWVVLTHGDERLRLERSDAGWEVVSPYHHPADPVAVERLLSPLTRGLRPDGRVGRGDLEPYGLDGADPVKVELGSGESALVSLYVGHDAPGGATFVRFPDDDLVVRANLGGRARFDRPARAWRDGRLWEVPVDRITTLQVVRPEGTVTLRLGGIGWSLAEDPAFPVDPALSQAIVAAVADLRAPEVLSADHPAGLDPPAGTLTLTLDDGSTRSARLGRVGDGAFAAIDGRDGVYRLDPRLVDRLLADREGWRDNTLWSVEPEALRELVWVGDGSSVRAVRDPRTGTWVGSDADPRALDAAARFLVRARVERFVAVPPAEAGFPSGRSIRVIGERTHTLELGGPGVIDGRPAVHVRDPGRPDRIGLLEADVARRLWLP